MSRPIPQPAATTLAVSDLVELVRAGKVRVPEFQRPLRWQWEDVRRLFDSIIRGYPVGSLLFWKRFAPAERIRLGALQLDAPEVQDGLWVVDGQQRLTSLANALSEEGLGDERFAVGYDLEKGEIIRHDAQRGEVIPLAAIFDLQRLFQWLQDHPELKDHANEAAGITKVIREFKVPAYIVEQQDEAVLRDIFDRMNNYGKRLSRAEVFAALHPGQASASSGAFSRIIDDIASARGFGALDDDTVLRAILARRGPDVSREIRDEFTPRAQRVRDFGGESKDEAYDAGARALERAVAFLQEDADVPHVALLTYRYLLVVLTRFFALFPHPNPRNRQLLRRWYWRATLTGPSAFGGWTQTMRALASRIADEETASLQRLLDDPIRKDCPLPKLHNFRANAAEGRVALCALWSLGPRSPQSGCAYTRRDLADHLEERTTPRSAVRQFFVRGVPQEMRLWASNWYFALGDEAEVPLSERLASPTLSLPSLELGGGDGLPPGSREMLLESHALTPSLVDCLVRDDREEFLRGRREQIEGVVEQFLRTRVEPDFEDTPPLDSFDLDDDEADPGEAGDELDA